MLADRIRMISPKFKSCRWIDISTPITIVKQSYNFDINNGRQLTRLKNGYLACSYFYNGEFGILVSRDNGNTWSKSTVVSSTMTAYGYATIASYENNVYLLINYNATNTFPVTLYILRIEDNNIELQQGIKLNEETHSMCNTSSMVISSDTREIHTCWSCRASLYDKSFNIFYKKGVINENGSVSWSGVIMLTNNDSYNTNYYHPCIFLTKENKPIIIVNNIIYSRSYTQAIYPNSSLPQKTIESFDTDRKTYGLSSVCVDKHGTIHLVSYSVVELTNSRIWYSKSTDNGITWSKRKVISIYGGYPSIAVNNNDELFVYYHSGQIYKIYSNDLGESWARDVPVTEERESYPSLLDDNTLNFESPLAVYTGSYISPGFKFMGKWYECS